MNITHTEIYKYSIPMHPFTIATGTMHFAQNIFLRIHNDEGFYGVGECSAFPMIAGETQATCFEMARDFAALWKGRDPLDIKGRMAELDSFTAFNSTIKSAFEMALFDLAAKNAGMPLYAFLGGTNSKELETDITVGIGAPADMASQARAFCRQGFRIIKVKLGKDPETDIERVREIRQAVGPDIRLRIDANQGWDPQSAWRALLGMATFQVDFCEQPMRRYNDHFLPALRRDSPIPLMADESVFDHHDAERLLGAGACDYVNIKFAKSGGILEASRINAVCESHGIPCMMGGMLESRLALSAFAHFALANDNVVFFDMDTCMLGHKLDPVTGGVRYRGYLVEVPESPGIGADADAGFLAGLDSIQV
jgi:L-Ala-D/L-Glu epimerase